MFRTPSALINRWSSVRPLTRALILVVVAALSLATAQVALAATAAPAFSDTFEDGDTADWTTVGGTWTVVTDGSRVFQQGRVSTVAARAFNGSTAWTDLRLQARVKPLRLGSNGFVGIVARASSRTTFYRLVLLPGDTVQLQLVSAGTVTVLGATTTAVTAGRWYTLAIDTVGRTIRGLVDGVVIASASDPTITAGRIGLETTRSTAEYDDVTVTLTPAAPTSPSPSPSPVPPSPSPIPTSPSPVPPTTNATVAADGTGTFRTVQEAVDAAPANSSQRFTIGIRPGTYRERITVPTNKPFLAFIGLGTSAADTTLSFDNASGTVKPDGTMWGTSGSASVTISGHDFLARNLTFANTFDEAGHPEITSQQAVAVLTNADRLVFDGVRFLGNQDTLYVNSPNTATVSRAYFRGCYIEGDVDFIFGRGTAVFDGCEIRSLNRGSTSNNGYVTAASTTNTTLFGFLFNQSTLTSTAAAATVFLGRPWHPSNDPNAIAQVVFRDCTLGGHIKSSPWTDMSGFSWKDARFAEFSNHGAGSTVTADRPQLSTADAANATPSAYLAGADGWSPF